MGKYYAIGDIHGMLSKLEALLDKIPVDKDRDTLVFLGDYLDRGPEPRKVIQRIIDLMGDGYEVIALKGNHEAVFLKLLQGNYDYWDYRESFDGASTLKDYSQYRKSHLFSLLLAAAATIVFLMPPTAFGFVCRNGYGV